MLHSIVGLYHFQFIQNALLCGVFIAVASSIVGYFLIGGGYTFAGHALPNIGFAGAAGAVLFGVKPVYGLFVMTILAGAAMSAGSREPRERDVAIGVVMSFALGLGLMFLSLYGGYAERVYSILFGTVLGITRNDVILTGLMSMASVCLMLFMFRPLLFMTFDPFAAEAKGVPVRMLTLVFLLVVAVTVSLAVQVVGALLVFTMLVGPGATATRLTQKPGAAILLSALLGVAYMFAGITLAGLSGNWPVSFFIASISFLAYMPVRIFRIGKGRRQQGLPVAIALRSPRGLVSGRDNWKKTEAEC
ncbi:MAG: metal ABC transporter permease [Syntrophobacteraceae bacterium]|nr:metal ABC transporter permease [Syntrophobacteraceae bacterium]